MILIGVAIIAGCGGSDQETEKMTKPAIDTPALQSPETLIITASAADKTSAQWLDAIANSTGGLSTSAFENWEISSANGFRRELDALTKYAKKAEHSVRVL